MCQIWAMRFEGLLHQAPLIMMSFSEQALPPTCVLCPRGLGTRKVRIWATARPTGWIKSLRRFVVSKHFHLPEWAAKMRQFTDRTVVKVKRSPVPYFAAHSFYYHCLRWRHTAFKHPNGWSGALLSVRFGVNAMFPVNRIDWAQWDARRPARKLRNRFGRWTREAFPTALRNCYRFLMIAVIAGRGPPLNQRDDVIMGAGSLVDTKWYFSEPCCEVNLCNLSDPERGKRSQPGQRAGQTHQRSHLRRWHKLYHEAHGTAGGHSRRSVTGTATKRERLDRPQLQ